MGSRSGENCVDFLFNAQGAKVVVADLPTSAGADVAKEIGDNATFAATDVRE
jgi:NAD(P)-dependent dehydrogenase (short-subunit alcohol dehydrogenase family)